MAANCAPVGTWSIHNPRSGVVIAACITSGAGIGHSVSHRICLDLGTVRYPRSGQCVSFVGFVSTFCGPVPL